MSDAEIAFKLVGCLALLGIPVWFVIAWIEGYYDSDKDN